VIEMEHSPITLETLRNMVLATRGLPALPFARVPVNETWTAKRVLDAGVFGVIFPFTSTPELARQAVAACRYPPHARRGSGATLARFRWPDAEHYSDSADENITVVGIIEEVSAVDRIDEIAATPGLDVLFIGTSDLSFSLGLRGEQQHPHLDQAIGAVVAAAKRHGKFLGRPANSPAQVAQFREQGFQLFQAPTEIGFMSAGARQYFDR
jgi:2-keto-3-deoxy-L-rhamnonate aldolase RhmA